MIDPIYSIVEKLAILEGRIAPTDRAIAETTTKQKKPALFNNLKKYNYKIYEFKESNRKI
jgi:hypothetical protein